MRLIIEGGHPLRGDLEVPADKSITHRALMLGGISTGRSSIRARAPGVDNHSTAAVMEQLGANVEHHPEGWLIEGVGLKGLASPSSALDCGNSGTTIRLLSGLLAGARIHAELFGDESLARRPMGRVAEPLRALGADIRGVDQGGRELPPLKIAPAELQTGSYTMTVASAQVKSALLLAGLTSGTEVSVVEPTPSRDHTERMLRARGASLSVEIAERGRRIHLDPPLTMNALDVDVPGDFSSAAFWLAAGSLVDGSEIRVRNVGLNPGRTGFLEVLEELQASCHVGAWREVGGEPAGDVTANSASLISRQADGQPTVVAGEDIPRLIDELVVLSAVAARSDGRLEVFDARELRVKESDRIAETARLLEAFGVSMEQWDDGFAVEGRQEFKAAEVDVSSDHRIALSGAVLALATPGRSVLEGFDIAAVSYASFVDDLKRLGAKVEVEG
ncbi:MAG: 3-phosphoshikimate 1-carboxyvinyltransferase [Myxococcota bacterium]